MTDFMTDSAPEHHRLIILGSGPAGLTAALYAARANLAPLVLEGSQPGGQLTITTDVENYPGFPEGIMGPELVEIMRKQTQRFGSVHRFETVEQVSLGQSPFLLKSDRTDYSCDALIIATGATAKQIGLPSEEELMGYGVSACATCDGFFFRDKEVAIVGGGDTAIEEAIFLTRFASKVTVIHRRDELRASKIMRDRALANDKIVFEWNRQVTEILGNRKDGVHGMQLASTVGEPEKTLACEGVFIAIGHRPNTELFVDVLETDSVGYLLVDEPSTRTVIPGVFAAGDVMDSSYRQAVSAAGSGCKAAIDAERWLELQE